MRVLNFGSLNLDYVYRVERFVRPGETLHAASRTVNFGGKGLNQSVALARAGAQVCHAGCVGRDGEGLLDMLAANGVYTAHIVSVDEMQGHTVIQVDDGGENCILLYGGSNRCVTRAQIDATLGHFGWGDWLLLQNEINGIGAIVEAAHARGLIVALNPSPCDGALAEVDLGKVSWLMVNVIEAEQIAGSGDPDEAWARLSDRYPGLSLLVTLGAEGSVAYHRAARGVETHRQPALNAQAVDTTAAGDTYTGYFIEGLTAGRTLAESMRRAAAAAAISVTRPGAAASIPVAEEVERLLAEGDDG